MAWTSFFKKLFGTETNNTATDLTTAADSAHRNENLSGKAFKKQLEDSKKAVLLDVRTAGEFGQGSLSKARNVDYMSASFAQKIEKMDKNATYFLFCRSGNRSGQACKLMHKQGFDVRNLSGGIGSFPS